jgi:hypothetical protein
MKFLFTPTFEHQVKSTCSSDMLHSLPEMILRHTDWDYTYKQTDTGCVLTPTFRIPYRNGFVPEIEIAVSHEEDQTILHLTGQPVKAVRIFMSCWYGFLLLMEVFLLVSAITSGLDTLFFLLIPVGFCAFGWLLCKYATKATFGSVVKAIQKEFA